MSVLGKIALVMLMATASVCVHAELKELNDSKMNELTAKAGITIDIEMKLSIGEIAYKYSNNDQNKGIRTTPTMQSIPIYDYLLPRHPSLRDNINVGVER